MKKMKMVLNSLLLLVGIAIPGIVMADSGLDSNYQESGSIGSALINAVLSLGELLGEHPGTENYVACHAIIAVICIIALFCVTAVHIFKLGRRKKNVKEILAKLGISLIPTIIYSLVCFLTELELLLYICILVIYIISFIIIIKIVLKKNLKKEIAKVKEIDKNFDEEEFSKEAFEIYKEVQLAWCDFDINKVRNLISEELYNKYVKKLEELKAENQKNIMTDIEYKSNKIIYIKLEENLEVVCELNVDCYDYIIDDKEKVIKGKKDKKINYTYKLVFSKNLKNSKYVLIEKKISKIKVSK